MQTGGISVDNIGLIGTGNMGGMLAEVMLEQNSVPPERLYIYNRSVERNKNFQASYPLVHAAGSIKELLAGTDVIFICVRPKQYGPLLHELKKYLTMEHIVATITSPVLLEDLERLPARRVVRTVPTIANKTGTAPLLLTFGSHWTEKEKVVFREWLGTFSDPVPLTDKTLRVSSDIVSCGPAFMSYLLQCFIEAAADETDIEYGEAEKLAEKMMMAYGRLLSEKHYSLPELCQKVNVPGGVTGEGLEVLSRLSAGMFEELIGRTHQKYEDDKEEMASLFVEE
ncbi:late competence protein ComER [Salibacterium lacus]|uniref:Late competence protein ComER n=1 Tax=Salibacterium lacus TaxID=1898109 RepID=A0ABW5SX35_9BACI